MKFFFGFRTGSKRLPVIGLFVVICFCSGCRSGQAAPCNTAEVGMTRQEFYREIYEEILSDKTLRAVYLPLRTETDPDFAARLCGDPPEQGNSYSGELYRLKAEQADRLTVRTFIYAQPGSMGTGAETYYIWRFPGNEEALWSALISDFNEIEEQNKDAVLLLCRLGFALLEEDAERFRITLSPNDPVSREEADDLRHKIRTRTRLQPINTLLSRNPDGNEISLCFSDPLSLFTVKRLTEHLRSQNNFSKSFVYFDETGTQLSLWIAPARSGLFSVPLDIAPGSSLILPWHGDGTALRERLEIAASFLPGPSQEAFLKAAREQELSDSNFRYILGESEAAACISVTPHSVSSGEIQIFIERV